MRLIERAELDFSLLFRKELEAHSSASCEAMGFSSYKKPEDAWYLRSWWLKQRKYQLQKSPFCEMCWSDRQLITPATEVDHIEPHKGDYNKFKLGKLQSLCARHHQGAKKREEIRGYSNRVGLDGMPLDPRHPIHRGRA